MRGTSRPGASRIGSRNLATTSSTLDLRGHGRSRELGARPCTSVEDYVREDIPVGDRRGASAERRAPRLPDRSLARRPRELRGRAEPLGAAIRGIVTLGSGYHFARGSLADDDRAAHAIDDLGGRSDRERAAQCSPRRPRAATRASTVRGDSALSDVPLRGWHPGALEPEILGEHLEFPRLRSRRPHRARGASSPGSVGATLPREHGRVRGAVSSARSAAPRPSPGRTTILAPPASVRPAHDRSRARDKTCLRHRAPRPHRSARRPRRSAHDVVDREPLARRAHERRERRREVRGLIQPSLFLRLPRAPLVGPLS